MINHFLIDTISKVAFSRNKFGDYVYISDSDINCRFREINDLTQTNNREEFNCDAMVWFSADETVNLGDLFIYEGVGYKVDQMVKARRGGSTKVEYIKCGLLRHRQVS